ncbi:MAG TPA: replication protein P [Porticoccaceae bacterium]|nr:replication protein P [Porticoccaceae bacterium]
METGERLANQAARDLATSSKNSATAAGPADRSPPPAELIDTINQLFALFRINYHNQFYSAFADTSLLDQAKRLWLESLRHLPSGVLLAAARELIQHSEYLPTLSRVLAACDEQLTALGLPTPRAAYREACNAPSPKEAHTWSHPAVYHAGRALGWDRLRNSTERQSWPEFQQVYRDCCRRALCGEVLALPSAPAAEPANPLDRAEGHRRLQALRRELGQ